MRAVTESREREGRERETSPCDLLLQLRVQRQQKHGPYAVARVFALPEVHDTVLAAGVVVDIEDLWEREKSQENTEVLIEHRATSDKLR